MSLSLSEVRRGLIAAGQEPAAPSRAGRLGAALLPLILILLLTAAVRLPFYTSTDKDEFFFAVIAAEWLDGRLPYVATFDIKPPGLFFIYLVAQVIFGESQATTKGMEIAAVALATWALYAALCAHGTRRVAVWVAILLPIFTLGLGGIIAVNMLLQLPLIVLAFVAALAAIDSQGIRRPSRALAMALLAGLAIGAAGMVKQTAAFEALALLSIFIVFGERGRRLRMVALFAAGAAIVPLAFAAYFFAVGHFDEMFRAVVLLALQRADVQVAASYPAELQWYFTIPGAIVNSLATSAPLVILWGGAALIVPRLGRIRRAFLVRTLAVAGLWLAAAFAGVVAGRAICSYYVLTMVPPLLILAGAFFCHGLDLDATERRRAFAVTLAVAAASLFFIEREGFFTPNRFLIGDFHATRQVSQAILDRDPASEDRLLVLNRGFAVFAETGLSPPTPYFHATHLLGEFYTPSADPLAESLGANPRFIVVADPSISHVTEVRARYHQALDYIATHYRPVAFVEGDHDSFTVYEFDG